MTVKRKYHQIQFDILSIIHHQDIPTLIMGEANVSWALLHHMLAELEQRALITVKHIPLFKKGTRLSAHPVLSEMTTRYYLSPDGEAYLSDCRIREKPQEIGEQ